jgi:glycosyltransferase involved in cell wall biosynthesis
MRYVRSPVKLVLAGGSANFHYYESLVRQYSVHSKVEFLGYITEEQMIELYGNALAVAFVPFDEDYGYVTLEAMFSGRPVVVTNDSGGPAEFVDSQTGFVVKPEPREIAAAIDELHANRDRALLLGRRGQEKVRTLNLSWSAVVEKLISAAS